VSAAPDGSIADAGELALAEVGDEGLTLPSQLPLAEWMQAKILGAAGEAVLDPGHLEEVRRPGDRELSWCLVAVDAELDLGHQLRHALNLVDRNRGVEHGDESRRIDRRRGAHRLVVERQDLAAGALGSRDLFEQRALADLSGAQHDDDARIRERRLDGALGVSCNESRCGHRASLNGGPDKSTTEAPRIHHNNPADPP
jgi:hypothetical protein